MQFPTRKGAGQVTRPSPNPAQESELSGLCCVGISADHAGGIPAETRSGTPIVSDCPGMAAAGASVSTQYDHSTRNVFVWRFTPAANGGMLSPNEDRGSLVRPVGHGLWHQHTWAWSLPVVCPNRHGQPSRAGSRTNCFVWCRLPVVWCRLPVVGCRLPGGWRFVLNHEPGAAP